MARTFSLPAFLALVGACVGAEGVEPPTDQIFYPTGLAVDPQGRHLFVASSNFDIAYLGGTLLSIDLEAVDALRTQEPGGERDEAELVVSGSTVRTGTFANELVVSPDGTRLFVTIRGDNSLTFADVASDGTITCADEPEGSPPACRGRFVLGREENDRGIALGDEPHALALHDGQAFVAHADNGEVGLFDDALGTPELVSLSDDFAPGSNGIAIRPAPSGVDGVFGYVTTRDAPVVERFDVVGDLGVQPDRTTLIEFLGQGGSDQRGIAFSADYLEAYIVSRFPESLLVLDTAPDESGIPVDEFVGAIEIGRGPSYAAVEPIRADGRGGFVYVVCFEARQVFVVDPFLREVVDILLTGEGPHALVFDPVRPLAYLSQFTESTIAVIDVDRQSPTYHQRVFTIGLSDPPVAAR